MNLQDQIGALEAHVDQLNELNRLATAALAAAERSHAAKPDAQAENGSVAAVTANPVAPGEDKPTLRVARPSHNEISLSIGSQTVTLRPEQIGQLIEELAHARASMSPEPPMTLAPGWRFASTKNPVMAVQKHGNGDRLLVARHTGHGWVPFTFSPDAVVQLYLMLTQR
ncbi:MAG TPA: hypothetical protein VGZ01_03930 [Trinickia sp.]|jgi:hypothetical protein|nr:hypothetical protein [Trinickia sp.]